MSSPLFFAGLLRAAVRWSATPLAALASAGAFAQGVAGLPGGSATGAEGFGEGGMPAARVSRQPIFFPPFPPSLDQPINRTPAVEGSPQFRAPPALAEYAGEFFYPQLSSHLQSRSLHDRQRQKLADYRAAKATLLKELRETLAAAEQAEPDARKQLLAALARRQTPALAELEKSAEMLRADLIAPDRNWSDFREWKLGDQDRRGYSPLEIGQVMRAYAFYQKGLLPAQRRLLREIVVDLALATEKTAKTTATPPFFFSPATSRIVLPDDIPADVAAKVAAYQSKKAMLKKELYDTIYDYDGKVNLFNNPIRGLADKQAARLAELDALAEEIRVGLEPMAPAIQPAPKSNLPVALATRSAELAQRRQDLQRDASAQISAIIARLRAARTPIGITSRFEADGLRVAAMPTRRGGVAPEVAQQLEKVREELSAIADAYGRSLAELVNALDDLRREVGEFIGSKERPVIDAALSTAVRAAVIQTSADAYRQYRIAVLLPGLSPAQRSLLFDAAIESLALPLPRGEMQPGRRANSW